MELKYTVTLTDGRTLAGRHELAAGANRIRVSLPEGVIASVRAELPCEMTDEDRFFVNGYQTWTYCPEYGRSGHIRKFARLPKAVIDHFGIDRYGDYHFVDYPDRPGIMHGETWCYFRRGESFRLLASLDERPGYTLLRYDSAALLLTVERDCAGLRCGGDYPLFELFYAQGGETEVFDGWFAAMGIKPRTNERLAGYTSWYNRYENISEKSILSDLEGCAQVLRAGDLFQIDDGWEKGIGDWEADGRKFPGGMRKLSDAIHEKGLKAGLWLAPFVCGTRSDIYREHKDWLYTHGGKPWYCGCNWGGFWSLDIDKPEVVSYLRECFRRVFDDWGFDLVKLDFLYAAAPFGSADETRAGRMTRGMRLLRELCGDKLILGCGVPLAPAFALVDYCRIGCDVSLDWDNSWYMRLVNRERVSTRQAIGNTVFRRQLNGRAFLSDPDVFILRDGNVKLDDGQKYKLAIVNSLFSGLLLCSDDMSRYSTRAREIYDGLLRTRDAKNIRVDAENGLAVSYELDGETHILTVE